MKRRAKTAGYTERLPSGRHRARKGKSTVGTYDTETEAKAALGQHTTMASEWERFAISRRKLVRYSKNDESIWGLYFERDPIASVPFPELARKHAKAWLLRMLARGLSAQTIRNAMVLARVFCADLLELELIEANPFAGLKLPKTAGANRTHDGWTVLDPDEQLALLDLVSDEEYHFVAFALHTGMRLSEIINLKVEDIDLDAGIVTVRRSKGGLRPKGGKFRKVPLIGLAIQAATWATECARGEYAFPSPRTGEKRYDGRPPHGWRSWLKAASFKRRVRFHDLRHTCATALLAGWWGRVWTLKEVQQMLGHAQQSTTERYAHMLDETVIKAGEGTAGLNPTAWGDAPKGSSPADSSVRFGNRGATSVLHDLALRRLHKRPTALWKGSKSRGAVSAPRRVRRVDVEFSKHGFWAGRKSRVAA